MPRGDRPKLETKEEPTRHVFVVKKAPDGTEPKVFCAWCIRFNRADREQWLNKRGTVRTCLSGKEAAIHAPGCEEFRLISSMFHCGIHAGFTTVGQCAIRYNEDYAADPKCKECRVGRGSKKMMEAYPQLDLNYAHKDVLKKEEVW